MQIFRPLRQPAIARLWAALAFSALGDQLYVVALGWVAAASLGAAAGYLGAARAATVLLVAGLCGRLIDRWDRRASMIGADLARAAALGVLVLGWTIGGQPQAGLLLLAVFVLAASDAVFGPALQTVLPQLGFDYSIPGTAFAWQDLCPPCKRKMISASQLRMKSAAQESITLESFNG